MTPVVTVIINSHNRPAYLAEAIDSVMAQTLKDWELLIMDHASLPPVLDTIMRHTLGDDRVTVVMSGRNLGNVVGTNLAARMARAHLLAFLDDDNRYKPEFLERMTYVLETCSPIAGVACESEVIRPDGRLTGVTYSPKAFDKLHSVNTVDHNELLVRRKAWEEMGGFDPFCFYCHDWDFAIRLQYHGLGYLPCRLVEYRVHDNRLSALTDKAKCRVLCLEACRLYIKKKHRL